MNHMNNHMNKILLAVSILLLTFGTIYGLSFDGSYQVKKVEHQPILQSIQTGFSDFMPAELENEEGSGRILKVPEPASMLLLGSGLLVLGRLGRNRFKN